MPDKPFYAVHVGRKTGVFRSWSACKSAVLGYSGASYRKCNTMKEARLFVKCGISKQRKTTDGSTVYTNESTIYTDGSCNLQTKAAGAGVFFGTDDPRNITSEVPGVQTSQRAELYAVLLALIACRQMKKVTVATDSRYAIKVSTKQWNAKCNVDIIGDIHHELDSYPQRVVSFKHVRGHRGLYGNEMADRLANRARKRKELQKKGAMLIGLVGPRRVGKDTVADIILKYYPFIKTAFAEPLKQACRTIFRLTDEQLYGEAKEQVDPRWGVSPREILQKVGTELFRDYMPQVLPIKDVWIQTFKLWYENIQQPVIVTDVRFPDEAKTVKDLGGILIRIERPTESHEHQSEQAHHEITTDFSLDNQGSLLELENAVVLMMGRLNVPEEVARALDVILEPPTKKRRVDDPHVEV
jgi:ribonuclease HI